MIHERRKFERFNISLDAAIKSSKYPEELFAGQVLNVSRGGLCLESPDLGTVLNDPMELRVKLPEHDTFISLTGNVAWNEQLDDKCLVGIELAEISSEAETLFSKLCR